MQIQAGCTLNYESIKALTHVSFYKRKEPRKTFIVRCTYSVVLTLAIFVMILVYGMDMTLLLLLFCAAVITGFYCFCYWQLPKMQYKALQGMRGLEIEYTFFDESMRVANKSDQMRGESEIRYVAISKVMETSCYLFIYQNKNQVYVVDKTSMAEGATAEVRKALTPYVKEKYILCKY